MTHRILFAALVAVAGATSADAQTPETKLAPQKGWHLDLASAKAVARKTGKPMMIVFRCDP